MAVNLDACIQCNRCVRACREEQVNDVIGYAMRGSHSEICSEEKQIQDIVIFPVMVRGVSLPCNNTHQLIPLAHLPLGR
jgi:Fe-S-cluster-containing dehydrogenase component